MYQEDFGRILPLGDMPTNGVADKTSGRRYLVLPPTGNGDVRYGLGGGERIHLPPP